jgi:hypothetical protein
MSWQQSSSGAPFAILPTNQSSERRWMPWFERRFKLRAQSISSLGLL